MKTLYIVLTIVSLLSGMKLFSQTELIIQTNPQSKDAYLNSISSNTNYANYENYFAIAWDHVQGTLITRSLFDFDLASIPVGAIILEAKLDLYYAINQNNPSLSQYGENTTFLSLITENWEENTVTWINQPEYSSTDNIIIPASSTSNQDYEDIDVSVLIQKIVSNPGQYFGIMMSLMNEFPNRAMCFASSDSPLVDLRPKLKIKYIKCPPPTLSFSYTVNNKLVGFSGISETGSSWLWDFGDGEGSYLQNPMHQYMDYGLYNVCVRVEDTCYYSVFCDTIIICENAGANFTWTRDGLVVNFNDLSTSATSWYWDFGDGSFSNFQNPIHYYIATGQYNVCLTSSNNCSVDTTCQDIEIVFSEIDENLFNANFSISPNPSKDFLKITSEIDFSGEMMLFMPTGRQIFKQRVNLSKGDEILIDTKYFLPGLYILRILGQGLSFNKKVILN